MLARNARVDWHPPEVGDGPVRRVAGEQHRLGDLARPLLGHAAAASGSATPNADASRRRGELRRAGGAHRPLAAARTSIRTSRTSTSYSWACTRSRAATGTMRRTPEVIDAWFDSGSMPFAQWHYPFEHRERWPRGIPATSSPRGWTRRADGSTRCSRSRPGWATRCRTTSSGTAVAVPVRRRERPRARRRRARRCRRAAATSSIRGR